ncbi:PaaI family thioesterase [Jannaschia sp.]|nr:PaaI family thioesterase [Jannaschia sp.]
MTGLEFIQAIRDGTLPQPPICRTLNYRLVAAQEGRVTFRGTPGFDHFNPLGTVHGGWYGTLLDSAMGCAVQTMLPKGASYTTLEYKVNLTRAIRAGQEIVCEGRVQHAGRSTGVATAEIRGVEDRKLYATGSTTCIVLRE